MKIPDKVKINGIIYDIKLEKPNCNSITEATLWGNINYKECKIVLDKTLSEQKLWQVLFHEIIHGIADETHIKVDEDDIDRVSNGFFQVMKDNNLLKD
jgi:hypothetical protein